jgi:methionyl-tRNA formyltransferase
VTESVPGKNAGRLRIALITADEPHHRCLASLLGQHFEVIGWIIEPTVARRRRLWRERRWRSAFWHSYHSWRRRICGQDRYRREFFEPRTGAAPAGAEVLTVDTPNSPEAIEAVRRWAADVVVICGTSILRQAMLAAAGSTIINVHGGFLPYYRGNHCFFFAFLEGDHDHIGSSIHFVDAGIDTGDIIEVVAEQPQPEDTPESLYCRCDLKAFERLLTHLLGLAAGTDLPRIPQPGYGRTFRTADRTLGREIQYLVRRATRR